MSVIHFVFLRRLYIFPIHPENETSGNVAGVPIRAHKIKQPLIQHEKTVARGKTEVKLRTTKPR